MTRTRWDLKAWLLQKYVQKKLAQGRPANSFEPVRGFADCTRENGIRVLRDIRYGTTYPNSFLDLMIPKNSQEETVPVVLYFHGGGFLFGSKASGDPLAGEKSTEGGLLHLLLSEGYAVASADYALAPQYRFPVPIIQANQALDFLQSNSRQFGLNCSKIIMMGGSAGADITEIYAVALNNPDYAMALELTPSILPDQLRAVVIDEAALAMPFHDKKMDTMLGSFAGVNDMEHSETVQIMSAHRWIRTQYVPAFITASNQDRFFKENLDVLTKALDRIGSPYVSVYPDRQTFGEVPHGFMAQLDTHASQLAVSQLLPFLRRYVK